MRWTHKKAQQAYKDANETKLPDDLVRGGQGRTGLDVARDATILAVAGIGFVLTLALAWAGALIYDALLKKGW